MAGNNLNRRATMESAESRCPKCSPTKAGCSQFEGLPNNKFDAQRRRQKRRIQLSLKTGHAIYESRHRGRGRSDDQRERCSRTACLLGGMSYYVDPELKKPSGGKQPSGKDCDGAAQKLLDCLKVSGTGR